MTTETTIPSPPWAGPAPRQHRWLPTLVRSAAVALAVGALAGAYGVAFASTAAVRSVVSTRSHLSGPFGLDTVVGRYADCTGRTPLTLAEAAIDTCDDIPYFVGHNVGVFTPVMQLSVGDVVTYTDASGQRHPWTVTAIRDVGAGAIPPHDAGVVAQMQTCISAASWRIVDLG